MKVLVTGGAGFIGANLVRILIEKSYRVLVLDDLFAGNLNYLKPLNSELIKGSILDIDTVFQAVKRADSVIHLAGQTSVVSSVSHPYIDFTINAAGTLNVLNACQALNIQRFIFASSNAAKQHNLSPYGASKRAAEGYCLAFYFTYGLETIILRLANVYGPYSAHKNSVIAKWFKSIKDKKEIVVEGGEQRRDFIHVADVCRAIIAALESDVSASGEIFQVGTGIETSISELAGIIWRQQTDNVEIKYTTRRQDDMAIPSHLAKINMTLDWQPSIKLADGLKNTREWFNDNSSNL